MKKIIKTLGFTAVILCVIFAFAACGTDEHASEMKKEIDGLNERITLLYEEIAGLKEMLGLPEQDFSDDKVIVEVKKEFAVKTFTVEDFSMIQAVKVELLVRPNLYVVEIANKGKLNVIWAIRALESVVFVKEATPDYICYPADD